MGSAALKPSAAVGRLLRQRRKELRLTLREVSERMAEIGEPFPTSTLVRVEQGKLDPGVRRLHLLLRLYNVPAHLVSDLVELEELAVEEPAGKDLETLFRDGIAHWKRGNVGEALSHLFAIRQHVPADEKSRVLRQNATHTFAVAARELGKLRLARQLVDDLLCEPPDPSLMARVLILASTLWNRQGSVEMALALIRRAADHVRPGDHKEQAWILHHEAKLLVAVGELDEATQVLDRAARLYRKLKNVHGEIQTMIVRVSALEEAGDPDAAISCARKVIRMAERNDHALLAVSGRLDLGRLLVTHGAPEKGLEELRKVLSEAVLLEDRIAEFYAHYQLWKAYQTLGQSEPMKFEFQAAAHFVQFIDEPSPEAEEIRRLADERKRGGRRRRGARS